MDVGNFISDLLGRYGEVSVPGLGYFTHTRINGHYNEKEGKMYPPAYSVHFDAQVTEDDTLAQYIADKKNISLASSKYFTDKYINNIKLQAQSGEVALADLGWFYTGGDQLFFRPGIGLTDNPEFFGYEPVSLNKLGTANDQTLQTNATTTTVPQEQSFVNPVATTNQGQKAVDGYRYETDQEHEAYPVNAARKKRRNSTVLFVVLAIILTAAVVYLVNRYNSAIFNLEAPKPAVAKPATVVNAKVDTPTLPLDTAKKIIKADSAPSAITVTDTITKSAPVTDTKITGPRYEILAAAFKTIAKANVEVGKYKRMGFDAHIADGVAGKKFHISLGTYRTKGEANTAMDKILNTGKLKAKDVYIQPIGIK